MPGRIVVIDEMLPAAMALIVVIIVVVPAPGGCSGAGIPRPMFIPANPAEPENPRLTPSLFLSVPLRARPLNPTLAPQHPLLIVINRHDASDAASADAVVCGERALLVRSRGIAINPLATGFSSVAFR